MWLEAVVKRILRSSKVKRLLKRVNTNYLKPAIQADDNYGIPETSPLICRRSGFNHSRLNLLIPALSSQHVFGGISTALTLFNELRTCFDHARIILTEEAVFTPGDNQRFAEWTVLSCDAADTGGHTIIACGDRANKSIPIGPEDRFIATIWWSAVIVQKIRQWQEEVFNLRPAAPFVYLIQDYEPGFYAWSSRYALAESTYHNSENFIAVINSRILLDYFMAEGYRFKHCLVFDPVLNQELQALRPKAMLQKRKKQVLIYGRPGVERNCFALIVMALQLLVREKQGADWSFVSAGEPHLTVDLGNDKQLVSYGKLPLESYARELGRSSLGVSLMLSPHPSYPPLEMAAFGMKVLTNSYKSKNLAELSGNIKSVNCISPQTIKQLMATMMADIEENGPLPASFPAASALDHYVTGRSGFASLKQSILSQLDRQLCKGE